MKAGVILLRAQPVHLGHIDVIKQAVSECDKVLVLVGSANKVQTRRNPLHVDLRIRLIEDALFDSGLHNLIVDRKIVIAPLNDWSTENSYQYAKEWGSFLYYNAVNQLQTKEFTFYYNDDIETVRNWFDKNISDRITIKNACRERDVSATAVRDAILNEDYDYLEQALSKSTLKMCPIIKIVLMNSKKEDFIMN